MRQENAEKPDQDKKEKTVKTSWKKRVGQLLLEIALTTLILVGIKIFMEGMYLLGVPQPEEVTRVTLSYPQCTQEIKELEDPEEILLAVQLTAFLKYRPLAGADPADQPLVTITYYTAEGKEITLSASEDTVWWKGRAHPLKHPGNFIKMTEGIFFLPEVQAEA